MRASTWIAITIFATLWTHALQAQTAPPTGATGSATQADLAPVPPVERFLELGQFADAIRAMQARIAQQPSDQQAQFSLGVAQFLSAAQQLNHALYAYGFQPGRDAAPPEAHLPIPINPNPQPIDYAASRQFVADFVDRLGLAQKTLAQVNDPAVKLPLHVGLIRLDAVGDGHPGEDQALWHIVSTMRPDLPLSQETVAGFYFNFDAGDAHWLSGYCHLLMALGDMILAYDEHDLFDATAPLFYPRASTSHPFLNQRSADGMMDGIMDAVAFVHLIRLPLAEPQRLHDALDHLHGLTAESRASWKFIQAETDDDHEWIPSPRQHSMLNLPVTQPMIDGWLRFLDEADRLLDGKVLLPFWRGNDDTQGVNLNKVFTAPRPFDLILWAQGTAAEPFLEHGAVTDRDVYRNLEGVFNGDLFTFAAYFN